MQITVSLPDQTLTLECPAGAQVYPVSTAATGAGEQDGSHATPRGRHLVRARFGDGLPAGAVFSGRRFTGEVYSPELAASAPERDWVLSRILWLGGLEPGYNQGRGRDSFRRFIYIHGAPDDGSMAEPGSQGCIRMYDADVIALFDQVGVGTPVVVIE